eukprot:8884793-Heterocapsa_arctica.AAC.1
MAGIVPIDWTSLPDSDFMKDTEVCHPAKELLIKCTLTAQPPKWEPVAMQDGDSGPRMILVSMTVVPSWERNKDHTELKTEHWWLPWKI